MSLDPRALVEEADRSVSGIPIDAETCFTDAQGRPHKGIRKEARRRLEAMAPLLASVLDPGETVRRVVPACSPYSLVEMMTTGWFIGRVRACTLVVTDRRLLHVPMDGTDAKPSVAQARFGDLESVRVSGMLGKRLELRYRDGSKEAFGHIQGRDGRVLAVLLDEKFLADAAPSPVGRRHHLCPRCAATLDALPAKEPACSSCGLAFKSRSRALWMSILVPGGGYFYTGHPILGVLDALVEGFLLLCVLLFAYLYAVGEASLPDLGFFVGVLVLEKLVTIYHSSHYVAEVHPADRKFRPA